jgi:hypothetical protein
MSVTDPVSTRLGSAASRGPTDHPSNEGRCKAPALSARGVSPARSPVGHARLIGIPSSAFRGLGRGPGRTVAQMRRCRTLGARPVLADALDPEAVAQAVAAAEPEVIVHQLTALSGKMRARDVRHPERSSMAKMTNRLRTEATDHLLAAGRAVGHGASWRRALTRATVRRGQRQSARLRRGSSVRLPTQDCREGTLYISASTRSARDLMPPHALSHHNLIGAP